MISFEIFHVRNVVFEMQLAILEPRSKLIDFRGWCVDLF